MIDLRQADRRFENNQKVTLKWHLDLSELEIHCSTRLYDLILNVILSLVPNRQRGFQAEIYGAGLAVLNVILYSHLKCLQPETESLEAFYLLFTTSFTSILYVALQLIIHYFIAVACHENPELYKSFTVIGYGTFAVWLCSLLSFVPFLGQLLGYLAAISSGFSMYLLSKAKAVGFVGGIVTFFLQLRYQNYIELVH